MLHKGNCKDCRSVPKETSRLEQALVGTLMGYAGERGDNEGVEETLGRIIQERDILLKNATKEKLLKLI